MKVAASAGAGAMNARLRIAVGSEHDVPSLEAAALSRDLETVAEGASGLV
jgi:hypothetical protein